MPSLSLLQSSFSIIKCNHVTAPGYLQHSLLSLLHLFIICLKHLLTFINVCVLIAKRPSQVLQPAQAQAGYLNLSTRHLTYTCKSGKRHLHLTFQQSQGSKHLSAPGMLPHMPAKCSCHGHNFVLIKNQLRYSCTYDFLWSFRLI